MILTALKKASINVEELVETLRPHVSQQRLA